MDGIVSGVMSIIPIMPDQSTITDRFGVKSPPVEILPLPSNSFMSEDATAELLNTPFTLSLDIKGYNNGESNGGKVGRNGAQAGGTAMTDDAVTAAMLNEAYTLSLSNEENAPIGQEIAREMSRMKNYEMLGKNATRQTYRMNPETGAAEHMNVQSQNGNSAAMITEQVRSLLSQSVAEQNGTILQTTAQNGEVETIIPQMQEVVLTSPELQPEGTAISARSAQPGAAPAAARAQQDMSLLSNLAAIQLSASDIEAILTLEPDLQEALLNMLSSHNTSISGKLSVNKPQAMLYDSSLDEAADGINPQNKSGVVLQNNQALSVDDLLNNAQPSIIRQALNGLTRPLNAADIVRMTSMTGAVVMTAEEVGLMSSDVLAGAKAQGALSPNTLRGSLANLQKVNELPYSLYLFGNVTINKKGDFEEEGDIAITKNLGAGKVKPTEFLKISEAIKMASVLHNIYNGGSGNFPQEKPWYAPYLRYAIKNGIVKNDEFIDFNKFATRAETAYIFSGSVPKAEFSIINFISDIPDVPETIDYSDSIYLLYRAGVLAKSDKRGVFDPESMITKTEAASIIGRIATPADRKKIL